MCNALEFPMDIYWLKCLESNYIFKVLFHQKVKNVAKIIFLFRKYNFCVYSLVYKSLFIRCNFVQVFHLVPPVYKLMNACLELRANRKPRTNNAQVKTY